MSEQFFPPEVTGDLPRITMTGSTIVFIEQHKGLAAFSEDAVVFRVAGGRIRIEGSHILFKQYSKSEALLDGELVSIHFERDNLGGSI